jgi:hypothetical protein
MQAYQQSVTEEFLDSMERLRTDNRGYHPFLIAIVDSHLQGSTYGNLFGSHRAEHGLAIIATSGVPDLIIAGDRMAAYFLYYFARYALSFLAPHHRNHDDAR